LREIAHHRANFGRTLSEKIQQIEETEFETIEAKAISPMSAGNEKAA
jgi:hypothetical protein